MSRSNFKYIFSILLLLTGHLGLCCINEYRTLLNGKIEFTDAGNASPFARFDQENKVSLLQQLQKADSIYKATGTLEDYSDYGVMLVYNGQYLQAKAIFIEIEKKATGLYATAANLGTTYELLGQNDSALFWISKAIKINPNSHEGSEWIHLKILEEKIKSNGDDKYFLTHNILALDFGDSEKPINKSNIDLIQLRRQLYHQLSERMSFIKPEDPIVGQLLFDLGSVNAIVVDVKSALQVYEVAKAYGFTSNLLTKREDYFKSLQQKADFINGTESLVKKNRSAALLILITVFIAFITGLIYFVKHLRKKKRQMA